MPNYEPVTSSNIESIAHEDNNLYVKFQNGSEYKYHNVSAEEFQQLRDAGSVGKHLNANIKPQYTVERIA